jgi:hypothetical protein
MKVIIPASAYRFGPAQERSGTYDSPTLRTFYWGMGTGQHEVDAAGIFRGVHGPRFSLKPVYHLKPVGQSKDQGIYTLDGQLCEPYVQSSVYAGACLRTWPGGYAITTTCYDNSTSYANSVLSDLRIDAEIGAVVTGRNGVKYASWTNLTLRLYSNGSISNTRTVSQSWRAIVPDILRRLGMSWQYCRYLGLKRSDYAKNQDEAKNLIWREVSFLVDSLADATREATKDWVLPNFSGAYPYPAHDTAPADLKLPVDTFHDQDRFNGDPVIDLTNYWVEYGKQHAFFEAIESVPRMSDNNIANILQFTSFIYNLVVRHEVSIPESLSDAWLSYRYSYNTTKLDVEEAVKFMRRHADKFLRGFGLRSYGQHTFNYEGMPVTVRCSVRIRNKQLDIIGKVWRALDTYGLRPNFYIVWDSIPFSFIADWFLPIGDVLSVADARQRVAEYYTFSGITYSMTYFPLQDGIRWKSYRRWVESAPPELSGTYWLEDGNVSPKLAAYRALDLASLILG